MDNKEAQSFHYTYSAKQQEEIKQIRQKYTAPSEDKMEQLRRLDRSVNQKATAVALVSGILGALLLGLGMSLAMTDLGEILGISQGVVMLIGVLIGVVGIVPISLAYPLYHRTLKIERERIAPEILRLTDELMK